MLTGHRTISSCLCRPGERRWVAGSDIQFVFNHALCIDTATEHHKMSLTSAHLSRVRTALSVDIALRETALTALWRNCLLATAPYLEVIDIRGIYIWVGKSSSYCQRIVPSSFVCTSASVMRTPTPQPQLFAIILILASVAVIAQESDTGVSAPPGWSSLPSIQCFTHSLRMCCLRFLIPASYGIG